MVLKFIFFQHYWELINVHHCTSLRCTTTWYSDLHRLWNDYQNRFSKCPSPYIDTIKRKERKKGKKKKVSLRWELLYFTLLLAFLHVIQKGELKSSCCTLIISLVLMYLIFIPLTTFLHSLSYHPWLLVTRSLISFFVSLLYFLIFHVYFS